MASLLKNFGSTARLLGKRPGFAVAAVMIVALGIGANTAIFSIVSGVLLKPLPFTEPDRLVVVWEANAEEGVAKSRVSPPTLLEWHEFQHSFTAMAAVSEGAYTLTGGDEPRRLSAVAVTSEFFPMLGVQVAVGRPFSADDDQIGAVPTVILSHALWRGRFGSDPSVVGQRITLDDESFEIIGVAARDFDYPPGTDVWTPLIPRIAGALTVRGARFLFTLVRLRPGVTLDQAESDLSDISAAEPELEGWGARLAPLQEHITGEVRPALLVLLAAVMFVLLISCANVANLLLARATDRRRELAIRSALGASRLRLVSQLVSESLTLAAVGGVLGLLIATWSLDLLIAIGPDELPRSGEIGVDGFVLAFALVITLATGVVAGLLPALRFSRPDLTDALKEGGYSVAGGVGANRLRSGLLVVEVAISLMLLTGAGLMVKSFLAIVSVDPGFRPERVLTFDLQLPDYRYPDKGKQLAFSAQLLERIEAIPGVQSAALARNLPFSGRSISSPLRIEGREATEDARPIRVQAGAISGDFFRVMGIRLVSGRTFTDQDGPDGPPVAVVNEAFARQVFPGEDAIGKRVATLFGPGVMREIVGVVEEVKHFSLTAETPAAFYTALPQDPTRYMTLVVRSELPSGGVVPAVRNAIWGIDPNLPIDAIAPLDRLVARSVAQPRFHALMLGAFAAMAVLLAMVGFYAVMAHSVAQRRREVGIRLAIGARASSVVWMVVREGLALTAVGVAIGLAGSFALTRLLSSLLFQVSETDATVFAGGVLVLFVTVLLATYVPARAASRFDPLTILRE